MAKIFPGAVEKGNREAGTQWHGRFLPGHFELSAKQKYQYQPRTKQYEIRKAKTKGHRKPLVWSGALKNAVTATNVIIAATPNWVKVIMRGPPWQTKRLLRFRGSSGKGPNMEKELTIVGSDEHRTLGIIHRDVTARVLNTTKAND